jgi:hypothetical protein
MLRSTLIAAASVLALGGSALAQTFEDAVPDNHVGGPAGANSVDIIINGVIGQKCRISYFAGDGTRFEFQGEQEVGDTLGDVALEPRCNFDSAVAEVTLSSANSGSIVNGSFSAAYVVRMTGGSGWAAFDGVSLASPVTNDILLTGAFATQAGGFGIEFTEPVAAAGVWTDTITASVTVG